MTVFVAEVTGDYGWPFEDQAIAGFESDDFDKAREFLVSALMAKNRQLFESSSKSRWDETSAIVTREATLEEKRRYQERKQYVPMDEPISVIWLIDF
jgi:hypothetical protein